MSAVLVLFACIRLAVIYLDYAPVALGLVAHTPQRTALVVLVCNKI